MIAVYSGSRADYGPLKYIIEQLGCIHISTTGMYGLEQEIRDKINAASPHLLVALGDRFETLMAAAVATEMCIPIAHIHGGEITEGANDDHFRHAISKLSYYHFVAHPAYKKRLERLGEHPDRIFVAGSPQIDAIAYEPRLSRVAIESELGLALKPPVILVTYHPETLSGYSPKTQIESIVQALIQCKGTIVISGANADRGGEEINRILSNHNKKNVTYRASYSLNLFTNIMRHCDVVVGNSSAGVIMAPAMGKPSINIGDRQKGRILPPSVVSCHCDTGEIFQQINAATLCPSPYKGFGIPGEVSPAITSRLLALRIPDSPRKAFYEG